MWQYCLIPVCLSNALSHHMWGRLISQLHFFWGKSKICVLRRRLLQPHSKFINSISIFIFTFSLLRCNESPAASEKINTVREVWALLDHSCSQLRSYVVEGCEWVTHQRPDSAWQSSARGAHSLSQWLWFDLSWPWLDLIPSVQKKALLVQGIRSTVTSDACPQLCYTHTEHKVFMTPCTRGHIENFIRYSVMSNAPISFPHPVHLCDWGG